MSGVCVLQGSKPTLLLNTMNSQLEAVEHRVGRVEDETVDIKQDLATAKQAEHKGKMVVEFLGLGNSRWPISESELEGAQCSVAASIK